MRKSKFISIILPALLLISACQKIEKLPDKPYIEYKTFEVFDTIDILGNHAKGGRLKFYFEDGGGDLGLNAPTGNQTDTTDLFFTLFRKKGGEMVPALPNDPLKPSDYRIPYMTRLGQDKVLKGTISVVFMYLFYTPTDTISYDFYIEDRSFRKSNVASTNEIILNQNKIY